LVRANLQDSTNSLPFLPAPGADDDASGTVTLISTLTQLLSHKFSPVTNPVEFHFYSAEEGGLLGSGEVAREYREAGKKVRGMFHMLVEHFSFSSSQLHLIAHCFRNRWLILPGMSLLMSNPGLNLSLG